jgi:hypothetical protein
MSKFAPPYDIIRDSLFSGQVIPFLGSGASLRSAHKVWERCADADALQSGQAKCYLDENVCPGSAPLASTSLPKSAELACYLARRANFPQDESLELTKVAQYCNVVVGRKKLDGELHSIFDKDHDLTPLHQMLADVPAPMLIVTTNYDDLIERAFDAQKREYDVVVHTTDPKHAKNILWRPYGAAKPELQIANKFNIDLDARTVIYKIHGAVDRSTGGTDDHYVITEDDYIDFLTRMTKYNVIPSIFSELFQSRSFLFLGYGLRDWNLRVVLNRIEREMSKVRHLVSWAIQHNPSALEERFWQNRGIEVFDMKIDDFVANLR